MRLRSLVISGLLVAAAAVGAPAAPAGAAPTDAAPAGRQLVTPGNVSAAASHHIRNTNSYLCLAARAGSGERPAVQTTCDFTVGAYWADQYWELVPATATTWHLYSPHLGLCLVARGSGETAVVATTCGSWADQRWYWLENDSNGTYQFLNANSGNCLTARGSGESAAVATTCDWRVGAYWADQHWYFP